MIKDKEIENTIKQYFSKYSQIQSPCVEKFLKNNLHEKEYLENILKEIPEWLSLQNIIVGIVKNFDLPKCKICGKYIKFYRTFQRKNFKLPTYCSSKCFGKDDEKIKIILEKGKISRKQKYGVESYSQTEEFKEKFKNTCLSKYGVENPSQDKNIERKRLKTNNKKYGRKCSSLF